VGSSAGRVTADVSWNGATDVVRWRLLAGDRAGALRPAGSARRAGFETRVQVRGRPRLAAVEALAAGGRVVGRSATVRAD
jgi:hypothetical protein